MVRAMHPLRVFVSAFVALNLSTYALFYPLNGELRVNGAMASPRPQRDYDPDLYKAGHLINDFLDRLKQFLPYRNAMRSSRLQTLWCP